MNTDTEREAWLAARADLNDKCRQVTDRLLEVLPDPISDYASDEDWGDPWGALMGAWFALNDAAMTADYPCADSFRPSPFGPDDENWLFDPFLTAMSNGQLTPEDVENAHKAFETAYHALDLLGVSY